MPESSVSLPSSLPTGTLTYLFSDVEGSTRLWEMAPTQMRTSMARHDELIERCVAQNDGMLVRPRGEGDSRFAVFERATNGVKAASAIQRSFAEEKWDLPVPLRVRIALHTGEGDLRDGDYYGSAVNRCARLRSVAHGGQTLISQITYTLVSEDLPSELGLRDLGEHKLKDLVVGEHIYQVNTEGLPADFPPIITPSSPLTNIPVALNSFIGRENEILEVKQLLSEKRLVTISGPGGAGKTRLAFQLAGDVLKSFSHGVWLVDLAPFANAELINQFVLNSLGFREEVCCSPLQTLIDSLRDRSTLLVLDNCEHLLEGVAKLVDALLRGTLKLKILATSREPLGVMGETIWNIRPLSTPRIMGERKSMEALQDFEAVKLFVDRARSVRTDFALTNNNVSAVAQICARLDGIPLAIELAAARTRILSVEEIAARLDDRFQLLVGTRTSIPRQKTLRNLIDWSYNLLPENERTLFRRLSVFSGGWTLRSAGAVCADEILDTGDILDLLARLVDKSLVISDIQDSGERYRFLETIRQYAAEKLAEYNETGELALRHANYFSKMAEDSYGELWGPRQGYWLARLVANHDNLRTALDWLAITEGNEEKLLRVAGSLWRFWEIRGNISEGRTRLEDALGKNPSASIYLRANGLRGAGMLAHLQGDYERAAAMHKESLALFIEIGDKFGIARELDALGEIAQYKGDYLHATELHTESLALRYEVRDNEGIAISLGQLGVIARDRADYPHARALLEQSLEMSRELGDKLLTAQSLNNLGLVEHPVCEYARASRLFEEAVSLYRELNDRLGISNTLQNLGNVAKDQGKFKLATMQYNECLSLKEELGDKRGTARVTVSLAEVAFYQGNYPLADELADKSLAQFKELNIKRGTNHAMQIKAFVAINQGKFDLSKSLADECLALSNQINSPRAIAYAKEMYALIAFAQGQRTEAKELLFEALSMFQKYDDRRNVALTSINLARIDYRQGDHDTAIRLLEESISISDQIEILWEKRYAFEIMGLLERSGGRYDRAAHFFHESLSLCMEQENQQGIANCLGAFAGLAILNGRPQRAAQLFGLAEKIRSAIGAKMGDDDRKEYEHYQDLVHQQLDAGSFGAAWSEGHSMTAEQAYKELI